MTVTTRRETMDPSLAGAGAFADEPMEAPLDGALPPEVFLVAPAHGHTSRMVPGAEGDAEALASGRAEPEARAPGRRRGRRRAERDDEVLPRGAIIDKYCIDRVLGRGGFAVVYRATHLLLGSPVAIKLLRPRVLARQPGLAALLCQEARFAARINHPNVVRVHDVTHTDRITYVVMEYIDGHSLAETIQTAGRLSPEEVVRVGLGVAAGLRVGLAQGLIHRDIKPANILIASDGAVKIVDLGLAHVHVPGEGGPGLPAGRPAVLGTFGYMSPEQALDPHRVDCRSDIYALGVTLYEAATGSLPFPARDPARCLAMHRSEPVPLPESRVPGFPSGLSALLQWMLAKRPEERPATYEILETALRTALDAPEPPRPFNPELVPSQGG
jgi:serine/threonine protein kinase